MTSALAIGLKLKLAFPHKPSYQEREKKAAKIRSGAASHPLINRAAPVGLEVYYDDKLARISIQKGRAMLTVPAEGQTVKFRLVHNMHDNKRYGVVVKVNGESTLVRERQRDFDYRKWILDKDFKQLVISGMHVDRQTEAPIKIQSRVESRKGEINYKDDFGNLTLTIFSEQTGAAPAAVLLFDDEIERAVIDRGRFPNGKSNNAMALRAVLAAVPARGPLLADPPMAGVTFIASPTPVMSATVRFYKP